jgi:hypothetical protein
MIPWNDWMEEYLDFLPCMGGGWQSHSKETELEEMKRFCAMDVRDCPEADVRFYMFLNGHLTMLRNLRLAGRLK